MHNGTTFKQYVCVGALGARISLWACSSVSRIKKLKLMSKVASSSFCWCVGAWTVNKREISRLKAAFNRKAKQAMKFPRLWCDSDESYYRRCNRLYKKLLRSADILELVQYVLGRMFDYVGHIIRESQRNPNHLTGWLINFRDALWKETMAALQGHQGHS